MARYELSHYLLSMFRGLSFFCRRALWDVGLNYGHGTGHGIGAYLNVHEYPPLISSTNGETGMVKNMFTSNG